MPFCRNNWRRKQVRRKRNVVRRDDFFCRLFHRVGAETAKRMNKQVEDLLLHGTTNPTPEQVEDLESKMDRALVLTQAEVDFVMSRVTRVRRSVRRKIKRRGHCKHLRRFKRAVCRKRRP